MNKIKRSSSPTKKATSSPASTVKHKPSLLTSTLSSLSFRSSPIAMQPVPRTPVMNRANKSLLHGKHIMFGNNVAHSERKTRRTWLPNVHTKLLQSETLGRKFKLPVTTATLRNIDRAGGFDNYLLKTRDEYLGGAASIGNRLKRHVREVQVLKSALQQTKREVNDVHRRAVKLAKQEKIIRNAEWEAAKPARAERMQKFFAEQAENGTKYIADYELKKSLVEQYADRLQAGEKVMHTLEDGTTIEVPQKLKKPRHRKLRAIERAQAIIKGETPPPIYGRTAEESIPRPHRKVHTIRVQHPPEYFELKQRIAHIQYHLNARTTFKKAHQHARARSTAPNAHRVPPQPWTVDRNMVASKKGNAKNAASSKPKAK